MNPLFWACALRTPTWCAHEMIRTEAETATRFASGRPGEVSKGSWKFWSAAWSVVLHPYWHSSGWCFGTYFMTFQKHLGISSSLTSCHIFQRGRSTTNQIYNVYYIYIYNHQPTVVIYWHNMASILAIVNFLPRGAMFFSFPPGSQSVRVVFHCPATICEACNLRTEHYMRGWLSILFFFLIFNDHSMVYV